MFESTVKLQARTLLRRLSNVNIQSNTNIASFNEAKQPETYHRRQLTNLNCTSKHNLHAAQILSFILCSRCNSKLRAATSVCYKPWRALSWLLTAMKLITVGLIGVVCTVAVRSHGKWSGKLNNSYPKRSFVHSPCSFTGTIFQLRISLPSVNDQLESLIDWMRLIDSWTQYRLRRADSNATIL